jgi:hypothetical protein
VNRDVWVQCQLRHGTEWLVTWLDMLVKPGDQVTLKKDEQEGRVWVVDVVYTANTVHSVSEINQGWDNNI